MALVLLDRAQQQGTANTTVSFTLTTLVTGFQSLAGIGNGNTTYYAATDIAGNWESGLGTYTTAGTLLTRTTVLESSNANAAVTFTSTVNVIVTYPAIKSAHLDANGNLSAAASLIVNTASVNLLSTDVQSALNETTTFAITKANAAQAASTPIAHATDITNPHAVTKVQVGLASVDNTSDTAKPVSTLQAQADALVASNAATDATTKANAAQAASAPVAHVTNISNPHAVTKAQVGLSNADNTSDINKPVSTAQAAADALVAANASSDALIFSILFGAD